VQAQVLAARPGRAGFPGVAALRRLRCVDAVGDANVRGGTLLRGRREDGAGAGVAAGGDALGGGGAAGVAAASAAGQSAEEAGRFGGETVWESELGLGLESG
jgi:hypothetical protein